uniref:Uncharacterized protein n=1 Tax=Physcomitrium patens TaxID=3218 RepID=A0A7I4DDM5_PHYPA
MSAYPKKRKLSILTAESLEEPPTFRISFGGVEVVYATVIDNLFGSSCFHS